MPISAPPVINGTSAAFEQPLRYGFGESGLYVVRTWQGTRAAIEAVRDSSAMFGAVYEVKQGIGVDTLEARYAAPTSGGGGEAPVDSWEFHASVVEKDFLEADLATLNSLTAADRTQLLHLIVNPPATPAEVPAWDGLGADLYGYVQNGLRSVRVNAPTLRHTQTVSSFWTVKAALTHVGKILSTGTLASFESIPGEVLFNLPTDVSKRTNMAYGWYKFHPTVRVAAGQKMQIVLEYEYGLWATLLYNTPL